MREFLNSISGLVLRLTLPVTVFVLPLLFLPLTNDVFLVKQMALVIIASLALVAFAVQTVIRQRIMVSITPATIPALILGGIYLLSAFVQSSNKSGALQGEVTTILALIVIFLATTFTLQSKNHLRLTLKTLFASLSFLSLWIIVHSMGLVSAVSGIVWLEAQGFNPAGGPLPFLLLALPSLPVALYLAFKVEKGLTKMLLFAVSALMTIASFIAISLLLPGQPLAYTGLPLNAGWEIAVAVLSRTRTSLLGTGPESFSSTFTQARPAWLNYTAFWGVRFGFSTNSIMHTLTTLGVLGFGAWVVILGRTALAHLKARELKNSLSVSLRLLFFGSVIVLFLVPPFSILVLTFTFISLTLLALDLKSSTLTRNFRISMLAAEEVANPGSEAWNQTPKQGPREMLSWILLVLVILLVAWALVFKGKAFAAQMLFSQSLNIAAENGLAAYQLMGRAIQLDPQNPAFHATNAQMSFSLAQNISGKTDLSDQDRNNVNQLIQLSIGEAKLATTLDPSSAGAWQNLGNLYQALIESAEGADQLALATLANAVNLDPTNPQLRLQLGEIYFRLKNYTEAGKMFDQALSLKNDLPNAHYGLAITLREVKQYSQALAEMKATLALLKPDSEEYTEVQSQITALEPLAKEEAEAAKKAGIQNQEPVPQELTPTPTPTAIPTLSLPDETELNLNPTPAFPYPITPPPPATDSAN